MTTSFPASCHGPPSTLRHLKLLVLLLVLSNIGLGLLSVYLLRKTDRRYSALIESTIPVLNDLQDLTVMSVQAMRSTNPVPVTGLVPSDSQRLAETRKSLDNERERRAKILQADWIVGGCPERSDLEAAGREFSRGGYAVLAQLTAGRAGEANRIRDEVLRPAFDRYLVVVSKAVDLLEQESRHANEVATAQTGSMSTVVLGLATWPVVVVLALFLLTAAFVLVLMVMFRGREISDMP